MFFLTNAEVSNHGFRLIQLER